MKPPKCKICGAEHWSGEPHAGMTMAASVAKSAATTKAKKSVAKAAKPLPIVTVNGKPLNKGGKPLVAGDIRTGDVLYVDVPMPKNSRAKASKAKPAAASKAKPDGEASRPHRGGGTPASVSNTFPASDVAGSTIVAFNLGTQPPVTGKRGRPKMDGPSTGKTSRAEYQRELMRKKRAAAKKPAP